MGWQDASPWHGSDPSRHNFAHLKTPPPGILFFVTVVAITKIIDFDHVYSADYVYPWPLCSALSRGSTLRLESARTALGGGGGVRSWAEETLIRSDEAD